MTEFRIDTVRLDYTTHDAFRMVKKISLTYCY